ARVIRTLRGVLSEAELAHLNRLAEQVPFVDGRATNPDSTVKHNLQVSHADPRATEPGLVLRDALVRHPDVRAFALAKQIARPTRARSEPGMASGGHGDEALSPPPPPMRSDLSCTVWLSPPESYEGGELVVELGEQQVSYKGAAGDGVLYPSTSIHRVTPVT